MENNIDEAKRRGYGKINVAEVNKGILVASNAIIIDEDGNFLVAKRSLAKGGLFALPGGTKQNNESIEECLVREMEEEIGLKLPANRYQINNFFECFSMFKGTITNVIHFGCVAHISNAEKQQIFNAEPNKCEGLFWMPKEKVLSDEVFNHFFLSKANLENYFNGNIASKGIDCREKATNELCK